MAKRLISHRAIAALASKLLFRKKAHYSQDSELHPRIIKVCTQVIQRLSIISAYFLYLEPYLDSVLSIFIDSDDIRCPATTDNQVYTNRCSSGARPALLIRKNRLKLHNVSIDLNATASLCVSVWTMETLNASAVNSTPSNRRYVLPNNHRYTPTFAILSQLHFVMLH